MKQARALVLTPAQRVVEVLRPWVLLGAYIAFALLHIWWLAVPAALCAILAGFVQMHDTIHNALGLSKQANSLLLTLSALLLLKSGHRPNWQLHAMKVRSVSAKPKSAVN